MDEKNYLSKDVKKKAAPVLEKDGLELICIKSCGVGSALKTEAVDMPCACVGYEGFCNDYGL